MRVPDQIQKCVLFVGIPGAVEAEYRGTAYIVTVPGAHGNSFAYMATAQHVAKHLNGHEYFIRVNNKNGTTTVLQGHPTDPWFFHPDDPDHVDAAVTFFNPTILDQLDISHIPISMFADEEVIAHHDLGVGDEVFITGLFTKIVETTKNIPIVRTGTAAMIPGELIPFGEFLIEANLIEARSLGGLSGSPVFIRETLKMPVFKPRKDARALNEVNDPTPPDTSEWLAEMQGAGRFFFGSVIGHWNVPLDFTTTEAEAVNMGIAPIVPAKKIKEIILQPELVARMKAIDEIIGQQKEKKM